MSKHPSSCIRHLPTVSAIIVIARLITESPSKVSVRSIPIRWSESPSSCRAAPQKFGPRRVSASEEVMIVGGAVLLVVGISLVAVLQ